MTAYAVFVRDRITNPEEMKIYGEKAALASEGFSMKGLALYGAVKTLEGPNVDGALIVEFQTMEAAQSWYDNPLYQEAMQHRLNGSEYRVFLVEGVAAN